MSRALIARLEKLEAAQTATENPMKVVILQFVQPRAEPGALLGVRLGFGPDAVELERGEDETEEQLFARAKAACKGRPEVITEKRQWIPTGEEWKPAPEPRRAEAPAPVQKPKPEVKPHWLMG
jgi:hypothetical protein